MFNFLSDCRQIEEITGKTYQLLAMNRSYAPEVRKVFQRLSNDEQAHAKHLDLVHQTPSNQLDVQTKVSSERVQHAKMLAEQLFYLADKGGLKEERALEMAVQMEQEFVKVHVHNSLHFYNKDVAKLFDKLRIEDQDHIDVLNDCLKWWRRQQKSKKPDGA